MITEEFVNNTECCFESKKEVIVGNVKLLHLTLFPVKSISKSIIDLGWRLLSAFISEFCQVFTLAVGSSQPEISAFPPLAWGYNFPSVTSEMQLFLWAHFNTKKQSRSFFFLECV